VASTFNANDAAVYERSMGRWSRLLAPGLISFSEIGGAARVLDVGCGTGALLFELASDPNRATISGIDASDIYATSARGRTQDPRIAIHHGDACAMPFSDAAFDAALSQLVLQFVPDTGAALAEMRRVVRPGGVVAAAVWNSGGGMPHQRMFWDTAAMLDPEAAHERGRNFTRPLTRRGDLEQAFRTAGLVQVIESALTIWMEFQNFADFWSPIVGGEGTLGKYVSALPCSAAKLLERYLRTAYESGGADGSRQFACTAAVCRGLVSV